MRVQRLMIEHFRGIPGRLELDFRARADERPRSLLLFGDNGSGKSSVVDAVEFAVRGRISRLVLPRREERRIITSLAGGTPQVTVEFDTGTSIVRGRDGQHEGGERELEGGERELEPMSEFALAPIVLRRSDILRFWDVPEEKRQLVFFEYFRGPNWGNRDSHRRYEAAEEAVREAEKDREAAVKSFVRVTHVSPSRVPSDNDELDEWRRRELGPKFGRRVRRGGQSYFTFPRDVNQALQLVTGANRRLKNARTALERARRDRDKPDKTPGGRLVREILEAASAELDDAFRTISKASHIREIQLEVAAGDRVGLDVTVHLTNGASARAKDVLSEAGLDLLALLVFTSIAAACADHGQEKLLIFDDVFQSVDSTFRTAVVGFLLDRFADWQLVFTVHDRLWFERLQEMFRQRNLRSLERRIIRWTFADGPVIRDASLEPDAELRRALESGDLVPIAAAAGMLLEELADRLSWTIGSGVSRRYGDRYTLGDVWPGVHKHLRRTSAKDAAGRVEELRQLRNLLGAHYNEWARSLTDAEAREFGEAVLELFGAVYCADCGSWIAPSTNGKPPWECRCGHTVVAAS